MPRRELPIATLREKRSMVLSNKAKTLPMRRIQIEEGGLGGRPAAPILLVHSAAA
jgi:hypothetical protein